MVALRIGIIVDRVIPYYMGGYERRYWELARRLAKNNDVHIFTSCPQSKTIEGIKFHKVAPPFPYFNNEGYRILRQDFYFTLKILGQLEHLDVIDCNATPFFHIPIISLLSKLKGIKIAITVHEVLQKTFDTYLRFRYHNSIKKSFVPILASIGPHIIKISLAYPRPELIITVSDTTAEMLKSIGLKSNISIIPNGIDTSILNKNNTGKKETNDIVFVGRLSPEKRVEDLLKGLYYLKKQHGIVPKAKIVGDGPKRKTLIDSADSLGVSEQTEFTGSLPDQKLFEILRSSKIFVLPSEREGFSIATLEAMACGLSIVLAVPSIPKEGGGALGLVDNGTNGLTYPVGNASELANRLKTLLTDDIFRAKLGDSSLEKAQLFDWDTITKSYEETLHQLVDNRLKNRS